MGKSRICIIGTGRMGGAVALALDQCGYEIVCLINRDVSKAAKIAASIKSPPQVFAAEDLTKIPAVEVVFICTPDPEIRKTAEKLAENRFIKINKPIVFHNSGALSSEILEPLSNSGCRTASLHPLISISDPEIGAKSFRGAYFCLEGDSLACIKGKEIVEDLAGKSFSVETGFKTLYHASAVTASGHLTALISMAVEMLEHCGLESEKARQILLPLIKSTVENLRAQNPAQSLTGTFARADLPTMENHLKAIKLLENGNMLQIYKLLGLRSVELAATNHADSETLKRMKEILENDQRRETT